MTGKKRSKAKTDDPGFPIIGMGASAGGLESFERFFRHMPVDSGMIRKLLIKNRMTKNWQERVTSLNIGSLKENSRIHL